MKKFTFLALVLCTLTLSAQDFRLGKVSEDELKLKECSFYPEANAMILGEIGYLRFAYSEDRGFTYEATVYRRVKVFNHLDKDIANITLSVYDPANSNNGREEIVSIKGTTYTMVNGNVEKTKLSNSEKYTTRISDYRQEVNFSMPNVQDGSVFEYQYVIKSDFISNLMPWYFQNELPTAYSEYEYTLPEFYRYSVSQLGTVFILQREEKGANEHFGGYDSNSSKVTWSGKNFPPLLDEPFMNNRPNVPCRLEFQLNTIQYPNTPLKPVATTFDEFNKHIMDIESFGLALKKGNFAKDQIATLGTDPLQIADGLYQWIRSNIAFNDTYGWTSSRVGRPALNDGKGSCATINLSLVAACREAGLEAYPVLLSTRGHGIPHPLVPNYEDFNYVIAAIKISDSYYLADATSSLPLGMLPIRCLNGSGWLASENGGMWIELKQNANGGEVAMINTVVEGDVIKSTFDVENTNYLAAETKGYLLQNSEKELQNKIAAGFTEMELDHFEISDSIHSNTDFRFNFSGSKEIDDPSMLYIQPILYGGIENQFKREERQSPVDFPYAEKRRIISRITIPDGYVAELPEPINMSLPNRTGRYMYSCSQLGNVINVISYFELTQLEFSPIEYPSLKNFYQLVSEKNSEVIVLKKL